MKNYTHPKKYDKTKLSGYGRKVYRFCEEFKLTRLALTIKCGVSKTAMQNAVTGKKVRISTKQAINSTMREMSLERDRMDNSARQLDITDAMPNCKCAVELIDVDKTEQYCISAVFGSLEEMKEQMRLFYANSNKPENLKIVKVAKTLKPEQKISFDFIEEN